MSYGQNTRPGGHRDGPTNNRVSPTLPAPQSVGLSAVGHADSQPWDIPALLLTLGCRVVIAVSFVLSVAILAGGFGPFGLPGSP